MASRCEEPIGFPQDRAKFRDVFQHAIGKDRAIARVRLIDRSSVALKQLQIGAGRTRQCYLSRIRIDASVDRLGEQHICEHAFAAAKVEDGTFERKRLEDAAFDGPLQRKGERSPAYICLQYVGLELQGRLRSDRSASHTLSISPADSEV